MPTLTRPRFLPFALILSALLYPAIPAYTEEPGAAPLVVSVTLNAEPKRECIVYQGAGGDIFVSVADLEAMGFRELEGRSVAIDGQTYLSLKSVRHLAYRLNTKSVSLKIAAAPRLLRLQVIDFTAPGNRDVERPVNNSFFVNYAVDYHGDDRGRRGWSAAGEGGARVGSLLLVTDGVYRDNDGDREFVRLMSRAILDRRETMQRLVLGDFTAAAGELGRSVIMGGVGFEKNYRIDPYVVKNPAFGFSGVSALPGEIEISVDGVPVRREKISPGEFELRNLWTYGGDRRVDVKIKDVFGREITQQRNFYFSDTLLRRGFQEYGYHLGFLREDFSEESNSYGDLAFTAYHRYGVNDALTAGFAAEGGGGLVNGGPVLAFPLGRFGQVRAEARFSRLDGETGSAGLLSYGFMGRRFDVSLSLKKRSREYAVLGQSAADEDADYSFNATTSYSLLRLGSVSLAYSLVERYAETAHQVVALSCSREFSHSLNAFVTVRNVRNDTSANEIFTGLTWSFDHTLLTGRYEARDGDATATVEAVKNLPEGEGWGYRALGQRSETRDLVNLDLRRNGRFGEYLVNLEGYSAAGDGNHGTVTLAAAGSLAGVGGALAVGRPVSDAFALVNVDRMPGVRVYRNGQEIGRTGGDGTLYLPRLDSYYVNEISIADKDVPMSYTIAQVSKRIAPAYRQGARVTFDVERFQALSGFLQSPTPKGLQPLEYREATVKVGDRDIVFPTGKGGEFYLENIPLGSYEAVVQVNGHDAHCAIVVFASEDVVVELGKITCDVR